MGQSKGAIPRPVDKEGSHLHTTEWQQKDFLLFLLLNWNIERVSRARLQEIWGFFLYALKKKGVEVEGFYRDIVTGRYRALENAIGLLFQFGLMESRSLSPGYFFFNSTPRVKHTLREAASDKLLRAIDEVGPIVLRLYKNEVSLREGLSILRSLRENTSNNIPT